MKKFLALIIAALMIFALVSCGGEKAEDETTVPDETITEETTEDIGGLAGGWTVNTELGAVELPEEAKAAFDKAMEGFEGVLYTPVAFLGTQVVAGTNYAYLCTGSTVTAEPVTSLYVVTVYEDLDGNCEVHEINSVDVTAIVDGGDFTAFDEVCGGWTVTEAVGAELSEDDKAVFDAASDIDGIGYEALACLGTQVVAGTNHAVLVKATTVTAEPVTNLCVVIIYEDLDGNAAITAVKSFPIGVEEELDGVMQIVTIG